MSDRFDGSATDVIKDLSRQLSDAHSLIRYLIARFGEVDKSNPNQRVIRVDMFEALFDSPDSIYRWEDKATMETCFGVRVDEH